MTRFIEQLEQRLFLSVTGNVVRETWTGISGKTVTSIPVSQPPTQTSLLTSLEIPTNEGSNFGDRIRGTITAPTSGVYTFWIAGDDQSYLYLSSNASEAGKTRIAYIDNYTGSRQWTKYSTQKSAAISLTAGQEYYFEVLHKQATGNSSVAVGWAKPGQATTLPSEIIGPAVLDQFDDSQPPPPPSGGTVSFSPTATPSLNVIVGAGTYKKADGSTINVQGRTLSFDAPQVLSGSITAKSPKNWQSTWTTGVRWDDVITLMPTPDSPTTDGALYKSVIPGSIVVKNAAGTKTYVAGTEYQVNPDWGQIANRSDRLGARGTADITVTYKYVKQRLDLIEVGASGVPVVKKGTSVNVVPVLPTPDAGFTAIAGIYVYTMDGARASDFEIRAADIFPINPKPPVAPINAGRIPNTLAKLKAGGSVRIGFFGDSITEGQEAGDWKTDRSLTYTQRVIDGLKAKYPTATINQTLAYKGGMEAADAAAQTLFNDKILNATAKPDLVVIALGMNDDDTAAYKTAINNFISQAQAKGIEVLLVSTMQSNPFVEPLVSGPTRAEIAQATRDVANSRNVALADVWTEWQNQAFQGIPPWSQLHNWSKHPGVPGHQLYANTILRFF